MDDLEKYNEELKDQLRKTSNLLSERSIKEDIRYSRIDPSIKCHRKSSPLRGYRGFSSGKSSLRNTMTSGKSTYSWENTNLLANLSAFNNKDPLLSTTASDNKTPLNKSSIKMKILKLKGSVNEGFKIK